MLRRRIRIQLAVFAVLTVAALTALGWHYLRLPSLVGIGQYTLNVDLPASGGLYSTANVTYRGITIGKVTSVEPTGHGVRATLSIDDAVRIPVDTSANVHSVSAVGEQYLDLVSAASTNQMFSAGQTLTNVTVPQPIGPLLDATNQTIAELPRDKLAALLRETSTAVGGLGPSLQRLVDSTQAIGSDLATNLAAIDHIIDDSGPLLDSQVSTAGAIAQWAHNVRDLARQAAQQDDSVRGVLASAAPTANQLDDVFGGVKDALPQVLANTEVVFDLLKRYHGGVEQGLVFLPQGAAIAQAVVAPYPGSAALDFRLAINQPPPCLTGFLPASQWRSPADTSMTPAPIRSYCKIPKDFQGNVVRGARNYPCADVPGKRAATPEECRSNQPYEPSGTNPWYGDPNQVLTCPAPAARCDQPVKPGLVVPAPTVDNGTNPAPADQIPPSPPPVNDALTPPGSGSVQCSGQQPSPCVYTPNPGPPAVYDSTRAEVVASDGTVFTVRNESPADDAWKDMLAPAG